MKHTSSLIAVIVVLLLFIGVVSAVTVFPILDPDFFLTDPSDSWDVSLHQETSFTGSSNTRDIIWSEHNSPQQADITATGAGTITVTGTNGSFAMHLSSIGHTSAVQPVFPGKNLANGNRLDIVRPGYTEWYISQDEGIEQGLSLQTRPNGTGPLQVSYTLSGLLQPVLTGQTILFFDTFGPTMRYGGLAAQDAAGRALPSEIMLSGNQISWQIDERDAVYPLTIDPYISTQTAILNASDKAAAASFGTSVSIYNNKTVFGATGAPYNSGGMAGQAYVFQNTGGMWSQTAILNGSDITGTSAGFGNSVSIYKDTALIGAKDQSFGPYSQAGEAYVFKNSGGTWRQTAILNASDKADYYTFGDSVSIYNDTIIVGSSTAKSGLGYYNVGAAYVFKNSGGSWRQDAILSASDKMAGSDFGYSVSVYNDTAVIGAIYAPSGVYTSGQAYVFRNAGGTWGQTAILNASDKGSNAEFGNSVSIYNDTILVGARSATSGGYKNAGQAYVFKNNGSNWNQIAILNASDKAASAGFGGSVSLSNDRALIGAKAANAGSGSTYKNAGQVYVFQNTAENWRQVAILNASDKASNAGFGDAVSIDNGMVLVGARTATSGSYKNAGQAYVFTLVTLPPAIISISPASGPARGGTPVTITGSGLIGTTAVTFGSTAGTITGIPTDRSITTISPPGTGTVDIIVATSSGISAISTADQFTYQPVPTITNIAPASGPARGGTPVTITGRGFTGATAVVFGLGNVATFTENNDTTITAISPPGTGTVDIIITTLNGSSMPSATDFFFYQPAPIITSIIPATGTTTTSVLITNLTGTGFTPGAKVTMESENALAILRGGSPMTATSVTVTSPIKITCTFNLTTLTPGLYRIVVTNPDGQTGLLENGFTVTGLTPTVTETSVITPLSSGDGGSSNSVNSGRLSSYGVTSSGAQAGQTMTFAVNQPVTANAPGAIISVGVIPLTDLGPTVITVADATTIDTSRITGRQTAHIASIELVGVNPSAISQGTITFAVTGSWLSQHDVTPSDIVLMRNHDGQWSELTTTFDHQSGDTYYFVATTPGFSYFGITTRVSAETMNNSIVTETPVATGIPDTVTPPAPTTIPTYPLSDPRPAMIQTTAIPASVADPAGSSGIPVVAVIAGTGGIVIVAAVFAHRWWIRRQNPALFKEYD
jgi:PGF-pre-PGF domain-containing protein